MKGLFPTTARAAAVGLGLAATIPGASDARAQQAYAAQAPSVGRAAAYSPNLGCSYEMFPYGQGFALRLAGPPAPNSPLRQPQIQLEAGDTIVALDDIPITNTTMLETHHSQTKVTFINTRTNQIEARWVYLPAQGVPPVPPPYPPMPPQPPVPPYPPAGPFVLGVVGTPVMVNLGVPQQALRITQVTPGSAAAAAGISPGMTILTAGPYAASDVNALRTAIAQSGGTLPMTVLDPGGFQARSLTAYMGGPSGAAAAPTPR